MAGNKLSGLWLIVTALFAAIAAAEVVRIEVASRSDVAAGAAYGAAGPYEKLRGTLHFAVDPSAPANRNVTDLRWRRRTRPAASSSKPTSSC